MGYACPVCDAPQADGEHLANHLAFTAMLHDDGHASFLDSHVDGWEDRTPAELAAELIHHADEVPYDAVFEDTTGGSGMGEDAADQGFSARPPGDGEAPDLDDETIDAETQRVIDEARALFMQGDEEE